MSLEDRARRAAAQLQEDESLTEDMDDAEAGRLLDWGATLSRYLVGRTAELDDAQAEELLEAQLGSLRRAIRKIGKLIGLLPDAPPEMAAARLMEALDHAAQLPGVTITRSADLLAEALTMRRLSPGEALELVLRQITMEEETFDG
jgi:hypothetical protein